LKKKIWANFQRIVELFTQKIVTKLSKIWVWDPGSEIRDPENTYSGSRGKKGTGSATLSVPSFNVCFVFEEWQEAGMKYSNCFV
jgi:hypothetical protein